MATPRIDYAIRLPVVLALALLLLSAHDALGQTAGREPEPDRLRAVLDLSVGDLDGPVTLTAVEQIVGIGSRVFVSQPRERLIRVLDAENGEFLEAWGGAGEGPGEFQRINWIGTSNEALIVLDARTRRLTRFANDGTVSETTRFSRPPTIPPYSWGWVFPLSSGRFVHFGDLASHLDVGKTEHPWVVADVNGALVDTLPSFRPADRTILLRSDDGRSSVFRRPLHRGDRFALAVDGSAFVQVGLRRDDGLSLTRYDSRSGMVQTTEVGIGSVRVPPHVRDSLKQTFLDAVVAGGLAAGVGLGDLNEQLTMPEWIPPVDEMFVSTEGSAWLREPSFSSSGKRLWRVVDQGGRVTAEVEVPSDVVLRMRSGDHVWGHRRDPTWGYAIVERYRLEPIGPAGN